MLRASRSAADEVLDMLGFTPALRMGEANWASTIPDAPGVYVIFDSDRVIYVGMAGRSGAGSLRRRLRDHASGQVVNMFAQYLLFARILDGPERPRTPREAATQCRAYIRQHCSVRVLALADAAAARRLEGELRHRLAPVFNASAVPVVERDEGEIIP